MLPSARFILHSDSLEVCRAKGSLYKKPEEEMRTESWVLWRSLRPPGRSMSGSK